MARHVSEAVPDWLVNGACKDLSKIPKDAIYSFFHGCKDSDDMEQEAAVRTIQQSNNGLFYSRGAFLLEVAAWWGNLHGLKLLLSCGANPLSEHAEGVANLIEKWADAFDASHMPAAEFKEGLARLVVAGVELPGTQRAPPLIELAATPHGRPRRAAGERGEERRQNYQDVRHIVLEAFIGDVAGKHLAEVLDGLDPERCWAGWSASITREGCAVLQHLVGKVNHEVLQEAAIKQVVPVVLQQPLLLDLLMLLFRKQAHLGGRLDTVEHAARCASILGQFAA